MTLPLREVLSSIRKRVRGKEEGTKLFVLGLRSNVIIPTPLNPDMWRRDGDLASQYGSLHTPKTPKSTFQKSVKVFFHKLAKRTKLKRNKSIDQMLGK